jgi:UDP-glucose 4-epimerase
MVDKKIFKKKLKAVVFGGSGFIGSHLVDSLHSRGFDVIVADLNKSKYLNKKIIFKKINIKNREKVFKLIKNVDIVYNFAAVADIQDSYDNPLKTLDVNIIGCANIIQACAEYKIKRFILASSIYANTDQGGFYRVSKQSCEIITLEYAKVYNLNYTILRFGSIYGPRSNLKNGLLKIIYDSITKKKLIYRGTRKAIRSYIYVKDAAESSVDILNNKFRKKIVLIKGKKEIRIISLLLMLKKMLNLNSKLYFLNRTQKGHYDKKPKPIKSLKTTKYYRLKTQDFMHSIKELIKIIETKNY